VGKIAEKAVRRSVFLT